MSRYFQRKGWGVRQFSMLRPLSEFLVQKILARRYPDLFEHQVSCHAAHTEAGRVRPCGQCEKCRRIVGMLVAATVDPGLCGDTPGVNLKDWSERTTEDLSAKGVAGFVFGVGSQIKDAFVLAFEPPPIEGLSMTGGFHGFVRSRGGGDYKQLEAAVQKLVAAANQRPELAGVTTSYSASVPQIRIDLDREKAKLLGVNVAEVFETLQSTFGALYVNDFNRAGRVFRVHLQSEAEFPTHPDDIRNVYVRTGSGELIPLKQAE